MDFSHLDSLLIGELAQPTKDTKRVNKRTEPVDVDLTQDKVDAAPAKAAKKRKHAAEQTSAKPVSPSLAHMEKNKGVVGSSATPNQALATPLLIGGALSYVRFKESVAELSDPQGVIASPQVQIALKNVLPLPREREAYAEMISIVLTSSMMDTVSTLLSQCAEMHRRSASNSNWPRTTCKPPGRRGTWLRRKRLRQ